jgi:hypothetical protein
MVGVVVVLKEVDDGRLIELPQHGGGAETAMGDDEVGFEVGRPLAGLVYRMALPDGIFEGAGTVMGGFGGAAAQPKGQGAHPLAFNGGLLGDKPTFHPRHPDKSGQSRPELGRVIRVDKQDVHGS